MIKKTDFLIGLEMETEYNADLISFAHIGNYHNALKISDFWRIETDGSLRNFCNFKNGRTAEYTTKIFKINQLNKVIDDLKEICKAKEQGQKVRELNSYFNFNTSCGNHIHFSLKRDVPFRISKRTTIGLYKQIRILFFKRLKEYDIKIYEEIKKQYFRHFARRMSNSAYSDRYFEFNLSQESQGLGLEWRSFNLFGILNWKDYQKVLEIALNSLLEVLTDYFNGNFKIKLRKVIKFNIPELERKEYLDVDLTDLKENQIFQETIEIEKEELIRI